MMNFLISLDNRDKIMIVAFILVFFFLLALIGYIGTLIIKLMKWQSRKLDSLVGDAVYTRVIKDRKHFIKYARKKNWRYFFQKAWIPLCIILLGVLVLIIRDAVCKDFSYNVFDYNRTGFNTLFFVWDFSDVDYYIVKLFGWLPVLKNFPRLVNTPHWSNDAWASYIFMLCMFVGGGWYFVVLQCTVARTIRIFKKADKMYQHNLDKFNIYETPNPFDQNK